MAAEAILGLQKRRTKIGTSFVVDVTEFIDTTFSAQVSRWPVEPDYKNAGHPGSISDNILLNPMSFSMTGFISNAPLDDNLQSVKSVAQGVLAGLPGEIAKNTKIGTASLIGTGLGAGLGAIAGGALALYSRDEHNDPTYTRTAMETLIRMYEFKKPFSIETYFNPQRMVGEGNNQVRQNVYTNMVITSLNFPQNVETGDGLAFTMQCEQIQIVNLQINDVDGSFIKGFGAANSAPKKKDLGAQGTKTPTPQVQEKTSLTIDGWRGAKDFASFLFGGGG